MAAESIDSLVFGPISRGGPGSPHQANMWRCTVPDKAKALDHFLAGLQGRAYRMAQFATGSPEDALDLVQDAMFKLVEKYRDRPSDEWLPLFHRILQSRINDWHRRNQVRNRHRGFIVLGEDDEQDPLQTVKDPAGHTPETELQARQSMEKLHEALLSLPLRQQQAFLLRAWEGLDVRQTARAMDCAEGSVKTHYSRAVHSLRAMLGDHWP